MGRGTEVRRDQGREREGERERDKQRQRERGEMEKQLPGFGSCVKVEVAVLGFPSE